MTIHEFMLIFGTSFVIGLSGAMMPGPVLSMTISETLLHRTRRGWLVGLAVPAGHAILEIGLMIALWLGASVVLGMPGVLRVIGLAGGITLIVFGVIGLRSARRGREAFTGSFSPVADPAATGETTVQATRAASLRRPFAMGFVLSATSSGWWAWWASIGLNAIAISSVFVFSSVAVFVTFFLGHLSSDFAWYGLVGGLVSASKKVMTARIYMIVLVATNIFLVVMGCVFVTGALA